MTYTFAQDQELVSVSFPKLAAADSFSYVFENCSNLTALYFPELTYIKTGKKFCGSGVMVADLPKLQRIDEAASFFERCPISQVILPELEYYNISNGGFINYCSVLTSVQLPKLKNAHGSIGYTSCLLLQELIIPQLSTNVSVASSITHVEVLSYGNMAMVPVGAQTLRFTDDLPDIALSFSSKTALTVESLNHIISKLPETAGRTITLGATNLQKLSDDEKAVAIEKGWTLA